MTQLAYAFPGPSQLDGTAVDHPGQSRKARKQSRPAADGYLFLVVDVNDTPKDRADKGTSEFGGFAWGYEPPCVTGSTETLVCAPVEPDVTTKSAIVEIRSRTGLTMNQLAAMFGVTRKAVHLWREGGRVNATNAARILRTLSVIRDLDDLTPSSLRDLLIATAQDGQSVLELLSREEYGQANTTARFLVEQGIPTARRVSTRHISTRDRGRSLADELGGVVPDVNVGVGETVRRRTRKKK